MVQGDLADAVAEVLGGTWTVTPLGGSSRLAFVARGDTEVVVRLDARVEVVERVAAIGVGPRVLGSGAVAGRPFVVQELVPGVPVTPAWIADHAADVARMVGAVARNGRLAGLADPLAADGFVEQLTRGAEEAGLEAANLAAVGRLVTTAPADPPVLVASHGDPNNSNILLAGGRLLLVDWDDLRRADPLRDLGQLAWWYLPEAARRGFIETAGVMWDETTEARIHWWVAAESLDVALRLLPTDPAMAGAFLDDMTAALEGRPNPRRAWDHADDRDEERHG